MAKPRPSIRRMSCAVLAAVYLVGARAALAEPPARPGSLRVVAIELPVGPHIAAQEKANRAREDTLMAYRLEYGMLPPSEPSGLEAKAIVPHVYPIYPFGGIQDIDLVPFHYVDLDPGPGLQDWNCGERTYDGHDAIDYWITSFGEQDGAVPVFSPLPGRVVHAQDGYPDRQRQCSWGTENYIQVDHGGGQITGYGHLRRGSVRFSTGERVEAGEELGEVASSGCSYWPHLHFVTRVDNRVIEPHTGACNPGGSAFRQQHPMRHDTMLWDFGFSVRGPDELTAEEEPPGALPRLGRIGKKDKTVYAWAYLLDLVPHSSYRVRAFSPDGRLRWDSGTRLNDNPEHLSLAIAWLTIPSKKFRRHYGTWTIEISLDGEVMIEAPLDYFKKAKRALNRPPVTPQGITLEPERPVAGEPLVCAARLDRLLDDPDYDIVRYFFEWRVNDKVVRERAWATRSDVLPASSARPGDRLRCTVVPHDGEKAGEAATAEIVFN